MDRNHNVTVPFWLVFTLSLVALTMSARPILAQTEPDQSGVAQYAFSLSGLKIQKEFRLPHELPAQFSAGAGSDISALGLPADAGRIDTRSGRWATLILAEPMIPGRGVGNTLNWTAFGQSTPKNDQELGQLASRSFREFIEVAKKEFKIDSAEIMNPGKITVHGNGTLVQINIPRRFQGVPVRDSYLTATVKHGNLTLFGASQWGDIDTSTVPGITAAEAKIAVQSYVSSFPITGTWGKTELVLIPVAKGIQVKSISVGNGYDHHLAWVIRPAFDGDLRNFEALVDAHSGEILSFEDTNHYAASNRRVSGGVLPVSNDGVAPDGIEQAGWPMPFAFVTAPGVGTFSTDSGGNLPTPLSVNITSDLSGQYVRIVDNCGAISMTSTGDIDFGTSVGTDCTTPGAGGPGNTHAARTGFYELNRIMEMARSHLPGNTWLQQQLTSNMNINNNCNAFWNGSTVNFYTSGGGCNNTGEIAGVFDHEWGHGMDANDAMPGIASPSGEGIADIYTALRLNTSCIGRNFRATQCAGFGDPCLACTGVRDIDYLKRASENPHDYTWSNANCGGSVHCTGSVYSEAVWSLWKRKLQAPPYNLDDRTAHEIVTRLTFIGGGNTGSWFSGGPPSGGCAANSGYLNYLAADDDNGDLSDGTPHMTAIYDAFNDQQIACETPTVQDSGCSTTPATAPVVTGTVRNRSAELSWTPVAGASSYDVFRTDGVHGCDFGKEKVASISGTSLNDTGLQNDREYSYVVIPKGSSAACFGVASACTTIVPMFVPDIEVDTGSLAQSIASGDSDAFIDNCEDATLTFDVYNTGSGSQANVRLTGVKSVSHPGTIVTSIFPMAVSPSSLSEGSAGSASFNFTAARLESNDDLVFEVSFTSDELTGIKTQLLTIPKSEVDVQSLASKTWSFETDLDGWTLQEGTFNQATTLGGADGTAGYMASSGFLDNQCDHIQSPEIQLTTTSTMTLWTNYEIEDKDNSGQWWDRANIAVFEDGSRNAVSPDTGRLYNATGEGATCVTTGDDGWADTHATWASSSWSAVALDSVSRAGTRVKLDIAYGTDGILNGKGFWFDEVELTDVELFVADTQSNACPNDNLDTDGDGLTNIEEFNINPLLDPNNPDTDNDGIQDDRDDDPLVASNFCTGDMAVILDEVISDARQCAAAVSVNIKRATEVTLTGKLEVISPLISIKKDTSINGIFSVISAHPCPACP